MSNLDSILQIKVEKKAHYLKSTRVLNKNQTDDISPIPCRAQKIILKIGKFSSTVGSRSL